MSRFDWMKVYDLAKRIFFVLLNFFPHLNSNIVTIIWWFGNLVDWSLIHSIFLYKKKNEISNFTFLFFLPFLDNNIITLLFFHCLVDGKLWEKKKKKKRWITFEIKSQLMILILFIWNMQHAFASFFCSINIWNWKPN